MTIVSVMKAPETVDHAALAETMPLDEIDVSNPKLCIKQDVWQPYFRRLRRKAPVHYCKESPLGPYWSVTKHKDIIALEVDHRTVLVQFGARRHYVARPSRRPRTAHVHRHGPAQA